MNRFFNTRTLRAFRSFSRAMAAFDKESPKTYEEAVKVLDKLQSVQNAVTKEQNSQQEVQERKVRDTIEIVEKVGLNLDELDKLNIIHVSGTKGKGSTCAFCESILRRHGYKTGFFSSPHLIEPRERMRINGQSLSREAFTKHFWNCYRKVEQCTQNNPDGMPAYFKFLTILALDVFLQEQVDVAIIEVGIGGQYDCTNIVKTPVVCGITSLGLDHIGLLGDTIEKIAWQKAGILKPGVPAVTGPQPGDSLQVIVDRSVEIGSPLYFAPKLEDYNWESQEIQLGIEGPMQLRNASIALQVCNIWMRDHGKTIEDRKNENKAKVSPNIMDGPAFNITEPLYNGLRDCRWPGRAHILKKDRVTYYLDGAHTPRSLQNCVAWFKEASEKERKVKQGNVARVLMFNATGDRKPENLLKEVAIVDFDCALFCPNTTLPTGNFPDQVTSAVTQEIRMERVTRNINVWMELQSSEHKDGVSSPVKNGVSNGTDTKHSFLFTSIQETLTFLTQGRERDFLIPENCDSEVELPSCVRNADHIQVLVTGSLHLVGGLLRLMDPELTSCRVDS